MFSIRNFCAFCLLPSERLTFLSPFIFLLHPAALLSPRQNEAETLLFLTMKHDRKFLTFFSKIQTCFAMKWKDLASAWLTPFEICFVENSINEIENQFQLKK
jgi:hypothetical protein